MDEGTVPRVRPGVCVQNTIQTCGVYWCGHIFKSVYLYIFAVFILDYYGWMQVLDHVSVLVCVLQIKLESVACIGAYIYDTNWCIYMYIFEVCIVDYFG